MFDMYFLKKRIIKLDDKIKEIEKKIISFNGMISANNTQIEEHSRQYNENKYEKKVHKLETKNAKLSEDIIKLNQEKNKLKEERNNMAKKFMLKDGKVQEVEVDEKGRPIANQPQKQPQQQRAQPQPIPQQRTQPQPVQQQRQQPIPQPQAQNYILPEGLTEEDLPPMPSVEEMEAGMPQEDYNQQAEQMMMEAEQQQIPSIVNVHITTIVGEILEAKINVEQLDGFMTSIIKVMENRIEDGIPRKSILQVGTTLIAGEHIVSVTIGDTEKTTQ